ncbi:2-hydroxychromene-2-carboxylate isomerase [Marinobacterium arenosum]|uniref:2-hydroxychromene-2-carboxylate isomerase n=1 Tax=Marinobacterium arenosum TaxID=2862496 RepID=UPI001C96E43C|nr:2-hydroxychromene-2-carboxylate isomerase [Marinobacterium arenosum]MBY4676266.1 2-hydroxychromene-2-carboxylate isomerase [Marinobacterium arenosum]
MTQQIDYYLSSVSPFTYLGHQRLLQTASAEGALINYLPMRLGPVFAASGALPLPQRPQCRRDYRLLELQRWARKHKLPINLQPRFFPADPGLADCCAIALQLQGRDPGTFIGQVLAACWTQERNISSREVLAELLEQGGFDVDAVLEQAVSAEVLAQYDRNTEQAVERGILGAPAYLLNGEQFWGQDRIELLADALAANAAAAG